MVVKNVFTFALEFSGVVAIFLIVYSGIKFITSEGDKAKIEASKKTLTYAIVGLVFIILSYFIIKFIADLTGVNINLLTTPPSLK